MCNRLFSTVSAVLFTALLALNASTVEAKEYKKATPAAEAQVEAVSPAPAEAEPAQSAPAPDDEKYNKLLASYNDVSDQFDVLIENIAREVGFHQPGAMRREELATKDVQLVRALEQEDGQLKAQIVPSWRLFVLFLGGMISGIIVMAIAKRKPKETSQVTAHSGTSAGIIFLLAIAGAHSLSAATLSPFYAEQGSDKVSVKLCGVTKADKVEFVSPTGTKPSADVTAEVEGKSGACVGLKLSVDDKAETGKYSVLVDGKTVPGALYIVPDNASVEAARAGGRSADGETEFHSFLKGLAQYYGLDEKHLLSLLNSSKPGTSKEAIGLIEARRQQATVEAAVSDPRLKQAFAAALTEFGNNLPQAATLDTQPVIGRLGKIEDDLNEVRQGYNKVVDRLTFDEHQTFLDHEAQLKTRKLAWDVATFDLQHIPSKAKKDSEGCKVLGDMKEEGRVEVSHAVCGEKPEKKKK